MNGLTDMLRIVSYSLLTFDKYFNFKKAGSNS